MSSAVSILPGPSAGAATAGTVTASGAQASGEGRRIARLIGNGAIALAVFMGGFVIFEPAPYELLLAVLLVIWFLFGMRLPRSVLPLLALFTLFNVGGVVASFQMDDWRDGIIYVAVSYFLALTSVFFAIVILEDMGRLRLVFRVYVASAIVTASLGIIGYFGVVPGFEIFTRFGRAMGAFQDPNVFGPFLVAPILYLVYGVVNRSPILMPIRAAMLLILMLGLFLSFSRGAWGLAIISILGFYMLLIVNEQRARVRLKYIVLAVAGAVAVALMLLVAIQFEAVADVLAERLRLVQDYDAGRYGRFARHALGFSMALDHPLGIGPLEFGKMWGEDTHNNLVKALMAHGWLGFASWVAIMVWTLVAGFKLLFRPRPWLPYYQIAYVVFVGHQIVGIVIDTDHWRHFYLMIGIVWGGMALEARWQRQRRAGIMPEGGRQPAA